MVLVSASWHLLVTSKKGAKFVPCKCTGTVKVVTHTNRQGEDRVEVSCFILQVQKLMKFFSVEVER